MKILICYWQFPEFDKHSAGLRIFEIIQLLLHQGHEIIFFADHRFSVSEENQKYKNIFLELGVICVENRLFENLNKVTFKHILSSQYFSIAILSHYFIFNDYAPLIRNIQPNCRLILDTVDLHFIREHRQAKIFKSNAIFSQANNTMKNELLALKSSDCVWVVSKQEKLFLLDKKIKADDQIFVIQNIHRKLAKTNDFEARTGIVFIGGYKFVPNVDAIDYFMMEIFPLINRKIPNIKFSIVGCSPPQYFYEYSKTYKNIDVVGFIRDHKNVLNSHRVAIAPLRFGAGLKGKIGEYLSCGLPVVSSTIAAEGFGFSDNDVVIADNPTDFASGVIRLYSNKREWKLYKKKSLSFIEKFNPDKIEDKLIKSLSNPKLV